MAMSGRPSSSTLGSDSSDAEGLEGSLQGIGDLGSHGVGVGGNGYEGDVLSAQVSPGEPKILGTLNNDDITQVVEGHMAAIRYCYQRELISKPSLAGGLVVKFVVARDGSVSTAGIKSSTVGDSKVENCVAHRFRRFRFPEPPGGGIVVVSYPFELQPSGAPPEVEQD